MQTAELVYVVYYINGQEEVMHFFAGNLSADDDATIQEYVNAISGENTRVEVIPECEFLRRGGEIMYFGPY